MVILVDLQLYYGNNYWDTARMWCAFGFFMDYFRVKEVSPHPTVPFTPRKPNVLCGFNEYIFDEVREHGFKRLNDPVASWDINI